VGELVKDKVIFTGLSFSVAPLPLGLGICTSQPPLWPQNLRKGLCVSQKRGGGAGQGLG